LLKGEASNYTGSVLRLHRAGYISNHEIFTWLSQEQNSDIYGNISISQYEDEGDVVIFNETDWIS
jgi:hypothetical protein